MSSPGALDSPLRQRHWPHWKVALAAALTLIAAVIVRDLLEGTYVYGVSDLVARMRGATRIPALRHLDPAVPHAAWGAVLLVGLTMGGVVVARA
jgi:hypothetical protein